MSTTELRTPRVQQRIYGLDALRAVAMLLGIVLHATIAYKVFPEPGWPFDNRFHSWPLEILYEFIHAFRMPLFYLVAGFFAHMVYLKTGETAFIQHRMKRIGLPFIISLIFILPLSMLPFLYNRYYIQEQHSTAASWHLLTSQLKHWNGMAHLWFLYYLMMFYVAMLVLNRIRIPLAIRFNFSAPLPLLLLGIITTLILGIFFDTPTVGVYTGIMPQPGIFAFYGFFFFLGYQLYTRQEQLEDIALRTWPNIVTGLVLTLLVCYLLWAAPPHLNPWLVKAAVALQTIFLIFGIMGFFLKYLNKANQTLRYISDASYWMYLFHMCWIAGLQLYFLYTGVPGWLRFWMVLILTHVITLLTYQWFIRYTFIGNILHGPRERPAKKARAVL
ncbi:acyltransferase family protein [Chitinophaga nivalis]|uniref:Acyltransferase family protein n=1 Tax=Chitinophaga nivalis TaxID=2991709 RepID=A0ABT3ILP1_9BACT|nr:acyltransferase family protein [Chitinophaga nivalis]MCW3465414.1 acyltransferase family protein [Chitinophaga nivalis]MCW3484894.1 acyltransferase family protein [Chitinophaga nivalis]